MAVKQAQLGVEDVLVTGELYARPRVQLDRAAANRSLKILGQTIRQGPQALFEMLVQAALEVCQAHTAGISVLRTEADGTQKFHWDALAGAYAPFVGGTTPRDFSPCGTTLDRKSPQLFSYPSRLFTYFHAAEPPALVEGLVLPIYLDGAEYGTLWIVAHDEQRKFNPEDLEVMQSLTSFTSAAVSLLAGPHYR